jgi:hypothetical protein
MQNKRNSWEGESPEPRDAGLRNRIRLDLERLGMAPRVSEKLAERLESRTAKLSAEEYSAVLGSVAAAYGVIPDEADAPSVAPEDIADVERLMQGVREEVQKLDEGLRMLAAYVCRLRERAANSTGETLH